MQIIYLDISNKGVVPTVYAKQGDVGRKFEVVLTDFGIPYYPPNGSAFSVWYSGSSGDGNYTDIGDKSAFFVSENKITVEMIAQMFSADGAGILCLTLNSPDGNQISSWNIPYICEPVPGIDSEEAKSYYTAFSNAVKDLPYPDASLSAPGKAADAAATGLALAGKAPAVESADYPGCYYRTVNGAVEWLNPPMIPGVEYRTTERYLGEVVYTKLVQFGALPNNTEKSVTAMPAGASLIYAIGIGYGSSYNVSIPGYYAIQTFGSTRSAGSLWIATTTDMSSYNGWITIKYHKG